MKKSHATLFQMPQAVPAEIDAAEYQRYMDIFERRDKGALFRDAYKKDASGKLYKLKEPPLEAVYKELTQVFAPMETERLSDFAKEQIVAWYIWDHRQRCRRLGDAKDDWMKAKYLLKYIDEVNRQNRRMVLVKMGAEIEEFIDTVNNIFDSAYFRKKEQSSLSDEECFIAAEKEFRERDEEIRNLAYKIYERRRARGESGNAASDWEAAKKEQPRWHATKRIATVLWNLAEDKWLSQDAYWYPACEIIALVEPEVIPYADIDPYEPRIFELIKARVPGQSLAKSL